MKKYYLTLLIFILFIKFSFAQQRKQCEVVAYFVFASNSAWQGANCALISAGAWWKAYNCYQVLDLAINSKKRITGYINGCEVIMEKFPLKPYEQLTGDDKKTLEVVIKEQELKDLLEGKNKSERPKTYVQVVLTIKGSDPKAILDILQATTHESLTGTVKFPKPKKEESSGGFVQP